MLHSQIAGRAPAGLKRLIGILKDWPDFPLPTAAVLEAWGQAAAKGRQLMIPLGQSAQGQYLKVPARALEVLARLLLLRQQPARRFNFTPGRLILCKESGPERRKAIPMQKSQRSTQANQRGEPARRDMSGGRAAAGLR